MAARGSRSAANPSTSSSATSPPSNTGQRGRARRIRGGRAARLYGRCSYLSAHRGARVRSSALRNPSDCALPPSAGRRRTAYLAGDETEPGFARERTKSVDHGGGTEGAVVAYGEPSPTSLGTHGRQ